MTAARKVFFADTCPTCTRAAGSPFRVFNARGKVTAGCIDHFHTGHIVTPSESAAWHSRPIAKTMRAASRKMRDGFVTELAA